MKKYQVAIIGTNIGAKHFKDFQKVSDRFNVHTLCGLTREAIDKILVSNKDTKISLNFDDVLKVKEIDIIDICLPPHLHFSACIKSLRAGKHVICEKPLVSSLMEVDELEKISKETGKLIFPVFQYRYGLGFSKLKALIKSGIAGKPFFNDRKTAESSMSKKNRELREKCYQREILPEPGIGDVLFYRMDLWHRGTPIKPDCVRYVHNLAWKKKSAEGINIWNKGWTQKMYYGWLEEFIASINNEQRKTLGFPDINMLSSEIKEVVFARYPLFSKL